MLDGESEGETAGGHWCVCGAGGDNELRRLCEGLNDYTCKIDSKPRRRALDIQRDGTVHFADKLKPDDIRKSDKCDLQCEH